MKNYSLILVFLLFPLLSLAQKNSVVINGWTNVGTFKCVNTDFAKSQTIYSFAGASLPNIPLEVVDFDCKNKIMTADFRKTLNSAKYPNLTIKFINFTKLKNNRFTALVEVKMMNVTKTYNIEFSEYQGSLAGNKRLSFSDFKIVPPKKMGGMVYVKDEIDLFFSLAIR